MSAEGELQSGILSVNDISQSTFNMYTTVKPFMYKGTEENVHCSQDALTDSFGWFIQGVLACLAFALLISKFEVLNIVVVEV